MNNEFSGKTTENGRKHRDSKPLITERRRNYLVWEPYQTPKIFRENILTIELKRRKILMNKPVYLGLSILEISKIVMHEFWCVYIKPKYGEIERLCYIDRNSFIVWVKNRLYILRNYRRCWN